MEESFPMTGGDGQYSYAKNSNPQREAADLAKDMLVAAILENLEVENDPLSFRIADLGCSTGPNTFIAVQNIIDAASQKYKAKGSSSLPDIQVFFNDHVSNDFNILFANFPQDRQYFASAVAGSFYRRLFPKASLDFFHSAFALQWLSRVPQELCDLSSPAYNRGRIYYVNAPNEVAQAYAAQYAKDMEIFLGARAAELAPGGLMALLIPARPDRTLPGQFSLGPVFQPLETSLVDMANEGIISEAKLDSFNLPIYSPSLEELRTQIKKNGCFDIMRMETTPQRPTSFLKAEEVRAGLEHIIVKHFGTEIIEQLFDRYTEKIAGQPPLVPGNSFAHGLFVMLKRMP